MDKFMIKVSRKSSKSDRSNAEEPSTSSKRPCVDPQARLTPAHTGAERMRLYKDNLRYNPERMNEKVAMD